MVYQARVTWNGLSGGPGYTVLNSRLVSPDIDTAAQLWVDQIRAMFLSLAARFPDELSFTFPEEVLELDTTTGALVEVIPITAPPLVNGTGAGAFSYATGVRVDWGTQAVVGGRRLKGRTFFVPTLGAAYDVQGHLEAPYTIAFQDAADAYLASFGASGAAAVWSRTHGVLADAVTASIDELGTTLRSRRD